MRIGVVGLGKMGLLHSSILHMMPEVQLAGVCEKSAIMRKLFKKVLPDILLVDDVTEFSSLNLDAVYITTPIPSHFAVAKTVYQKRIARHLFVEKTLTAKYSESKNLCELANLTDGITMVGYLRRFMVTFIKAKELIAQNAIGEPISFEIKAFSSDFCGVTDNPKASIARGGVLRDLGSYAIDLVLWFFGDTQVDSATIESVTGEGAEDSVNFNVHRESDGLKGQFFVSWCIDGYRMPEVILSISGSQGMIEVNDDKVSLRNSSGEFFWHRPDLSDEVSFWLGGPEFYRENAYFINALQTNSVAEPSFETASKVDLMIDSVQRRAGHLG